MSTPHVSRRTAVTGAAGLGLGALALAACSSDESDTASDSTSSATSDAGSAGAGAGAVLGATADVPVGGCAVFADEKVVVTQAAEGEFKAFSSVCTHQGCPVSASSDGVIPCTCHGSQFSLEDGSVIEGPATVPLAEVAITVKGDSISLA